MGYICDNLNKVSLNLVASKMKDNYILNKPFPHIVIDNLFNQELLENIIEELPDLSKSKKSQHLSDGAQEKYQTNRGDQMQNGNTKDFLRYLNSHEFVDFLQILTSTKQALIPDPHFIGGGYQEVKRDGMLKMHIDFHKHPETRLDRRLNCLIYLNHQWKEEYNGHLMLYNKEMSECTKKILPVFNRLVVFSTSNYSFHGLPEPIACPPEMSRKSLALYFYSNGRPSEEVRPLDWRQSTFFVERPGENFEMDAPIDDFAPVMWKDKKKDI
tara:strand:- start:531 stop:1340 length:810 start_codon:yes stop_codon:yes gene_type:complete